MTRRVHDIVTFDDVALLWERLQLLSSSSPHSDQRIIPQDASHARQSLQRSPRRQQLENAAEKCGKGALILRIDTGDGIQCEYLVHRASFKRRAVGGPMTISVLISKD